ncbi:MAG: YceI family protein [Anaerolineae bacterium]|mgnify:CR=1 FL=1|nr:YceI family protein [Anaerolineae bacterium]MBT7599502.1 YceI family protein [Anaerolineae bacterium]MBT7989266.1 YceI family protein [Anaerolineae bacterium]
MQKRKGEKNLLIIAILGTLIILGMAFFDRWVFKGDLPPGMVATVPVAADVQDNESQPTSVSEAEMPSGMPLFEIDPFQSEARFTLNEVLGGVPTTVVGTTQQLSGIFAVSLEDPQNAQAGEILIDARNFATDSSYRNRAIRDRILESSLYPYIRFVPNEIITLPEMVSFGESVSLEISGDLTIKDVTQQVTFTANITPVSETEISGHAETMVTYADYGINIPSVPRVANVDKEVLLEIDFVALLKTE